MDDDIKCKVCNLGNDEHKMLLCDTCDQGFHTDCMGMKSVPRGSWHCPGCVKKDTSLPSSQIQLRNGHLYLRVSSQGQNQAEYGRVGLYTQYDLQWIFAEKI